MTRGGGNIYLPPSQAYSAKKSECSYQESNLITSSDALFPSIFFFEYACVTF